MTEAAKALRSIAGVAAWRDASCFSWYILRFFPKKFTKAFFSLACMVKSFKSYPRVT